MMKDCGVQASPILASAILQSFSLFRPRHGGKWMLKMGVSTSLRFTSKNTLLLQKPWLTRNCHRVREHQIAVCRWPAKTGEKVKKHQRLLRHVP